MTAELIIDQIRQLSPEEIRKVEEFLAEFQADITAANRNEEIESGQAKTLSEEEVFEHLRERLT